MKCVNCRGVKFEAVERKVTRTVGDQVFSATVPAERCRACGEGYVRAADGIRFEAAIAIELARRGTTGGEAFRYMRRHLQLSGGDLARLLSVAPETVSRWEMGRRPTDAAAARLLGVLVLEHAAGRNETLQRLQGLSRSLRPPKPAKNIRLDLGQGQGKKAG